MKDTSMDIFCKALWMPLFPSLEYICTGGSSDYDVVIYDM